jgi:hypothetical protein
MPIPIAERRRYRIRRARMKRLFQGCVIAALLASVACAADEDPYLAYVKSAPEFQSVRQDPGAWTNRWNTWVYMPWRFQWTIGTGDAGGQFCKDYGFVGGFTDHGDTGVLPWLDKWGLLFYNDHTASKGYLYLNVNDNKVKEQMRRDPAITCGRWTPSCWPR